jgi:hypothetical protein
MRTPDGHSKLELTKYHTPAAVGTEPENPSPNRSADASLQEGTTRLNGAFG